MRFEVAHALFVCGDEGIATGIDETIQQLLDLPFDHAHVVLKRGELVAAGLLPRVPQITKQIEREVEQSLRGHEFGEQSLELSFQLFLAERFSVLGAALRIAEIVGIFCAAAGRPAGGQRFIAASAGHKAAQRKILVQVPTGRRLGDAKPAVLHGLPGLERDQRLMLGWDEVQTPEGVIDAAGIDRSRQQFGDALPMHFTLAVLRPGRLVFEKALDFGQRLESAAGIGLQHFLHNRGEGLVADE